MSQYEITFLLSKEEDAKEIEEILKSNSAKTLQQLSWGKKTLSYPIKKQIEAYFFNWQFEVDPSQMKALKQKLNFNDKIIRYLLIVTK